MKAIKLSLAAISLLACSCASDLVICDQLQIGITSQAAWAAKKTSGPSATKLDAKSLELANTGKWDELAERLAGMATSESVPTRTHAWLAFAYMFLGKCGDLDTLWTQVKGMESNHGDPQAAKLVEAFTLICNKKNLKDADAMLTAMSDQDDKDVLLNMALAAVAAKDGHAAQAVSHCQKAMTLAPDFAWGYRTLGFIQERSLKNFPAAEDAYAKALAVQPNFKEVRDLLVELRLNNNNYDEAIETAQGAISAYPNDAANYYRLSQIYSRQWRLKEAIAQLQQAIKLDAKNARFHRAMANIYRWQRKMPEAIAEQQKAVELSSDEMAKAFETMELASIHELAGDEGAAADNLKQAVQLAPKNMSAHQRLVQLLGRQKRYDDLVGEYKRMIVLEPKQANLRLGLADALHKSGKIDQAIDELKEAANLDSADPRAHKELGSIYIERKDYTAAAKSYTRALNINPSSVDDLVALGFCYAQNEDYMQAETALVTALALQQLTGSQAVNRFDVMKSLAMLLLTEGRYTEAVVNLDAVCAAEKNTSFDLLNTFLLNQAKALRDRNQNSAKEMVSSFGQLKPEDKVQQRPALVDALLKLGRLTEAASELALVDAKLLETDPQWIALAARSARLQGDIAQAGKIAARVNTAKIEEPEAKAEALVELAQAELAGGNADAAEKIVNQALDANPKSFTAFVVGGLCYMKAKDYPRALDAAKKALEINPYLVQAYLLTGDALAAQGKNDDAATNYKRAVELYPASLDAHRALRDVYRKLTLKEEAKKEDEIISQMEKRG